MNGSLTTRNLWQTVSSNMSVSPEKRMILLNAALFQGNWFICIFASVAVSTFTTSLLLLLHVLFYSRMKREWLAMMTFALLGYLCDSMLIHLNLMAFEHQLVIPILGASSLTLAPLWLLFLWLSFSCCLNHCLAYLQQRPYLAALLIILAIPFNYYIGATLTHSEFIAPLSVVLTIITAYWLLLFIVIMRVLFQWNLKGHYQHRVDRVDDNSA